MTRLSGSGRAPAVSTSEGICEGGARTAPPSGACKSSPSTSPRTAAQAPAASVRSAIIFFVLLGLLFASVVAATAIGAVRLPYSEAAGIVLTKMLGMEWAGNPTSEAIIWSVRLPRVLAAGLIGFGLAVAGAAMQGLFKNPLASPDLLGVSTGGAVGAVIAIFLGWSVVHPWLVPGAAFVVALIAVTVVYALGTQTGRTDVATLLLAGIAVSAFGGAVISMLYHFVDDGVLRQIVYWLQGNLSGKRWEHIAVLAPFVLLGGGGLWLFSSELNVLMGGEDDARAMGVSVERTKRWILALVSLTTGVAVSIAGIIGFVGLMAPHMLRLVVGPNHRLLLPASGLAGASFLIVADLVARTAFSPVELRTGIVTAVVGAPFFLYLLLKRRDLVRWS